MKKTIFLALIAVSIALLALNVYAQKNPVLAKRASNGVFSITKVEPDSVEFTAMKETKLYSVEFVAATEAFAGARISNSKGDIVFASGATAWPGSSLLMPKNAEHPLTLTAGADLIVSELKTPQDFKAEKIRFVTEKGAAAMVYDIATAAWE
ncbi:MAG: hypothetical protein FWH56_08580 [Betaproteobacteria bacterium]|nr:hypothetical protein [Betaproteobacteria bacterium]